MRAFNQKTLEKIAARLRYGYNADLLKDIVEIMNKWAVELKDVTENWEEWKERNLFSTGQLNSIAHEEIKKASKK